MSGDREGIPSREGGPPSAGFFEQEPDRPLGNHAASIALGSLRVGISGMDAAWQKDFLGRYAPYAEAGPTKGPGIVLHASRSDQTHFITPPPPGTTVINPVFVAVDPEQDDPLHGLVRVSTFDVAASFTTRGGSGRLLLSTDEFEPRERAVENVVRVATAWMAVMSGGLLMHSASIVRDGQAYLFFGQSGSGKSTLSAMSREGQVVSDDLTLMLPGKTGHPDVVGAPFRGTYTGADPVTGRYPVKAAFRLEKAADDEETSVRPARLAIARAEAIANLPFLVDQVHVRPGLLAVAEEVFNAFPVSILRFRKDDAAFWQAVDAAL